MLKEVTEHRSPFPPPSEGMGFTNAFEEEWEEKAREIKREWECQKCCKNARSAVVVAGMMNECQLVIHERLKQCQERLITLTSRFENKISTSLLLSEMGAETSINLSHSIDF